jgi:nucleoside transporter
MNNKIRFQLSAMMFLEFFIWGCWYVTMGTYLLKTLHFDGAQVGLLYGTSALGAMISPFFIGYFADRFFNTEKLLGVLHLVGAGLMYLISTQQDYNTFYLVLLLYSLTYMPTLALANSLSFQHINDPAKEFPSIRVLGTLGWIVAGLFIGFMKIEDSAAQFQITALASLLMGIYCFTLPRTPPQRKGEKTTFSDILGLDALVLFKDRSFLVMFVSSLLICIPLQFYYSFTNPFLNELGMQNAAGKMTMGQMSEIGFLLLMPLFFVRLGVKKMVLVGIVAWVVRYLLFAYGNNDSGVWMLYLGIILHGICYDFFFVTGQIFVDNKAPLSMRSSAQGLITFATYGVGFFCGSYLAGKIVDAYKTSATTHNWTGVWTIPSAISAVILVGFWLMFKEDNK